ncbi:hypothetical protein [Ulvibacterium marinum]|uniref:hypothetical protein n=1 Tax=Ulvibacterium marinum TaxID=2419782 RepID=UPI002494E067|nr:hypothetical protein [Ulvibacterium marinum]
MKVEKYTKNSFAGAVTNAYTPKKIIQEKNQFKFLHEYLTSSELAVKTIVIEDNYISKDFLDGHASYYSYCFENYPNVCKRVHFFRNEFDEKTFQNQILEKNDDFWEDYLGFVVVKPIPITVIGFTVLKTYSNHGSLRSFWGTRDYLVHLFGIEININSLAFQEQDTVIAACATTAIWSMLNKASLDFHTILKTPSQITRDADNVSPDGSRLFPNKGLSLLQICQSIVNSGLVSEVKKGDVYKDKIFKNVISGEYLQKILNAYSPIGIPIILVVLVPNGKSYGAHAITISGFKQEPLTTERPKDDITWHAKNIIKLYAHDDQWGPFARVTFKNKMEFLTHWTKNDTKTPKRPTIVKNIIVPVYPKIRISYEEIEVIVLGIDIMLRVFFKNKIVSDVVWDIKLDYSEKAKTRIRTSAITDEAKINRLTKSFPKYIWIAKCYIADQLIMEFVFDATGVNNAMLGLDVVCYLPYRKMKILKKFLINNRTLFEPLIKRRDYSSYYDFIVDSL